MSPRRTPLDAWTGARLGLAGARPSRQELEHHQLERLRATVAWAARRSPFYRGRLARLGEGWPAALPELASLPFTTPGDVREEGERFLCVSQDEVRRVVTLRSSGTTGPPKRLWFTAEDQESTIDFFRAGMSTLVEPGDRVLILLPGSVPGSVGALLATALERLGVTPLPHGPVRQLSEAVEAVRRGRPTSVVGAPVQVLALHEHAEKVAGTPLRPRTTLLTTDHVPGSLVQRLERGTGGRVFEHYGMTEMGLGGAVDCEVHAGAHLREPDLLFEVVDPAGGEVLPDGALGELVFTTLGRSGMPLLRYRTGDLSRILAEPCPCGSALRRLERVRGRAGAATVPCGGGGEVALPALDDLLFALPGLVDFTATVARVERPARLGIQAFAVGRSALDLARAVREGLDSVPAIQAATRAGELTLSVAAAPLPDRPWTELRKRAIVELQPGS